MSINVTVTGNPVSIKRGKMVTADPNYNQKDFERRRIMRLEQVRQQSKDIAEDVRNKVRLEKERQMKQIEEEGKQKLKNWQNRKLLELQTQFQEALKELGSGYKEGEVQDEIEEQIEQQEKNKRNAEARAEAAFTKMQNEKVEDAKKKAASIERKKITREIENARSALVTGLKTTKTRLREPSAKRKKRKSTTDIKITIPDPTSESGETTDKPSPSLANQEQMCISSPSQISEVSAQSGNSPLKVPSTQSPLKASGCKQQNVESGIEKQEATDPLNNQQSYSNYRVQQTYNPPLDTRISDRIKQRQLLRTPEETPFEISYTDICMGCRKCKVKTPTCDCIEKMTCVCCKSIVDRLCLNCKRNVGKDRHHVDDNKQEFNMYPRQSEDQNNVPYIESDNLYTKSQFQTDVRPKMVSKDVQTVEEIPPKPTVKLRNVKDKSLGGAKSTKSHSNVSVYEHANRFSRDKVVPPSSLVTKLSADDIQVIPSETDFSQKTRQSEINAQLRGRRALEKERIQKEYEEMLRKLPLLQKQERTCEIGKDKPEYHMSEARLKEKEKLRQQKMDDAYNKLFPDLKPAVITLPRRKQQIDTKRTNVEPTNTINVAEWDVDFKQPKMFTAEEVQEIIHAYTNQHPKLRQEKLKELLRSLKLQKEELVREIQKLPSDDSVNELINDLNSFSEEDIVKHKDKVKRKRPVESDFDSSLTDTSEKTSHSSQKAKGKSPRKKVKKSGSRRKVLILQNTSTQTTPKPSKSDTRKTKQTPDDGHGSSTRLQPEEPLKECCKSHLPCRCNKENETSEELCKILIKLDENDDHEVVVKAKDLETVVSPKASPKKSKKTSDEDLKSILDFAKKLKDKPKKVTTHEVQTSPTVEFKDSQDSVIRPTKPKKSQSTPKDVSEDRSRTWRTQLSKNSSSSASTSYMSPPDLHKLLSNTQSDRGKQSFYNLSKKPQQTNTDNRESSNVPKRRLLEYVTKLLGMSRTSVENLSVSSVSTVPTPSQSIVEVESNVPTAQLEELVKQFNKRILDQAKDLSYSPSMSPVPNNTSASSSGRTTKSKPGGTLSDQLDASTSSNDKKFTDVSKTYADITESCTRRIENLSSMINKIREEKDQMLKNPPLNGKAEVNDKEHSTAYMDLPEGSVKSSSSSSSLTEEEVYKKLLEIDMSLADKLRLFNKEEDNQESTNATHEEKGERLQKLKKSEPLSEEGEDYVPFLSDIPKLPKFEPQAESKNGGSGKRPPPSKGLAIAKRLNQDISLVPHELSTIQEAESQISNKLGVSPETPRAVHIKDAEDVEEQSKTDNIPETPVGGHDSSSQKGKDSSSSSRSVKFCDQSSCANMKSGSSSSSGNSTCNKLCSSSSDDIEAIEAMLKSIGMEWAIPTLHKTKDALALSSSSSSLDMSSKKKESTNTEISLKELLKKQLVGQLNITDDLTTTSTDISGLKESQRTSTPVVSSKSPSHSKSKDSKLINNDKKFTDVSKTYADITESCTRRIENLSSMINKIREEKDQMLKNPPLNGKAEVNDKKHSTAYMDLPEGSVKSSSSSSSLTEEEVYKKLLEIDMSLADKLRLFNKEEDKQESTNATHEEKGERLQKLKKSEPLSEEGEDYVPFLSDIPKLPKFEPQAESKNGGSGKRPPPSKGLAIAKRLNQDISLVPHELSTIQEAESQISNKLGVSPETPRAVHIKDAEDVEEQSKTDNIPETPVGGHDSSSQKGKDSSSSSRSVKFCDQSSCANMKSGSSSSSGNSTCNKLCSSSSDDIEAIEAMLKSIGMEWAIPTLHKTKDALALSSSSSSLDMSSKKKESTNTDISFKELLKKQLVGQLNITDDLTTTSTDISGLKESQRTSTPVVSSKSPSHSKSKDSKLMFSDTELSSVRNDTS
nr:unnamed protein product [Callosobruchus analis]